MSNRIVSGINEVSAPLGGRTISWVRSQFQGVLNIPLAAKAHVDGDPVEESHVLHEGNEVEFVRPGGTKGLCDWLQDPKLMQPWGKALLKAEDSLRALADSICRVRAAWPEGGTSANGPAHGGGAGPESLRQLASEVSDILRRCERLPQDAIAIVDSAWDHLAELPDWDAVGRTVLALLTQQAEAITQIINLVRRGERSGLPHQAAGTLTRERSRLLGQARDFRDSWPWSTGNKPDDEEDAAAARRVTQALPSFEALSRLAEQFPPPPEWFRGE